MRALKEYALYKGEEILAIGTIEEIAKKMNIKKETVKYYQTPVYKKRLINRKCSWNVRELVCLE